MVEFVSQESIVHVGSVMVSRLRNWRLQKRTLRKSPAKGACVDRQTEKVRVHSQFASGVVPFMVLIGTGKGWVETRSLF